MELELTPMLQTLHEADKVNFLDLKSYDCGCHSRMWLLKTSFLDFAAVLVIISLIVIIARSFSSVCFLLKTETQY